MSRPTGSLFAVCAALWEVMMLPCKYKQRSLAVLSLIMEAVSIVLDKYEKKVLVVLGAFLLAAFGFGISLFPAIKKNARLRNAKQDQVVQFFLSLIQLAAAFWQLVQTVSNKEDKIDFSIFFPLAIAAIAVIFAFIKKAEQGNSQSGLLPITNPQRYNFVPGSPDSGSDQIRISMGEENELFARLIPTLNNSVPGSTPIEPDGHIGISTDEENVEPPLTSSEPATLPGSTAIEPDGQNRISIDAENAELPLTPSEPASLPSRTPIEPDLVFVDQVSWLSSLRRRSNIAPNITSVNHQINQNYVHPSDEMNLSTSPLVKEVKRWIKWLEEKRQKKLQEEMRGILQQLTEPQASTSKKKLQEEIRRKDLQEETRWILQQVAELQDSTSKPYKKIAHLRNMKPGTKPVASAARPSATVRRRGKRSMCGQTW